MDALPPPSPPAIVAPFQGDHRCIARAAAYYNIAPELIAAIRLTEGGTTGKYTVNTNGSYDLGAMQLNTTHLRMFGQFGIGAKDLLNQECTNIFAGTYILYREIQAAGPDMWRAIGNYNSRTPVHHRKYQMNVYSRLIALKTRYPDYVRWLRTTAEADRLAILGGGDVASNQGAADDSLHAHRDNN